MPIGRFAGDRIVGKFGPDVVVRVASVVASAGMLIGLTPGGVTTAVIGFAIMGLGLSVVIPVVYSAAGSTPGIPSGRGVAAVATIGYAGFLAGPPALGYLAQLSSLRSALLVVVVLLAINFFFANALQRGRTTVEAAIPS